MSVDMRHYVFAVLRGEMVNKGSVLPEVKYTDICGTAFSVGNNFFVTAGHSMESAASTDCYALGIIADGVMTYVPIEDYERIKEYDLCFFRSTSSAKPPMWSFDEYHMTQDVQATGFPYGLDVERGSVFMRTFCGQIVCNRRWFRLANEPSVYELSFQCPRGLSGAPLFLPKLSPTVSGIVIGNDITEMVVYSEKEKDRTLNGETVVYEKVESMHLGIAIQARALKEVHSELLNCTVEKYLTDKGLLQL